MGEIISFGSWKEKNQKGLKYKQFYDYLLEDEYFEDCDLYEINAYMLFLDEYKKAAYIGQVDAYGRVYCQITEEELMHNLRCKKTKVYSILKKLEEKKLIQRDRPNKRDSTFFYVREYIPDNSDLMFARQTSSNPSCSENEPRDVRQTNDKPKNNYNNNIELSKIQYSKPIVKRKFCDFNQRQNIDYAALEDALINKPLLRASP